MIDTDSMVRAREAELLEADAELNRMYRSSQLWTESMMKDTDAMIRASQLQKRELYK
jgi:hypothetical protein